MELASTTIGLETAQQYANEERALLRKRYRLSQDQLDQLFAVMRDDTISTPEHVALLSTELAEVHGLPELRACTTMGELLHRHLRARLELDRIIG